MKWQVLMVSLAVAVALFLGGTRWKDRITAESELSTAWKSGRWVLVEVAAGGEKGMVTLSSPFGSEKPLKGFEKIAGYQIAGFDISPDLERVAWIDNINYNQPELHIGDPEHFEKSKVTLPDTATALACPLFDRDGSVLLLSGPANITATTLSRVEVAGSGAKLHSLNLPAINANVCPSLSDDGRGLAFMGTDGFIHFASRDPAGNFLPQAQTAGINFQPAPDGTWIAVKDGNTLQRWDVATRTLSTISTEKSGDLLAISPDGQWILLNDSGTFGNSSFDVLRVRDGVVVPLSAASPYPGQRGERWRARPNP